MTSPNDFTIEYKLMVREPGEGLRIHEVSEDRKDLEEKVEVLLEQNPKWEVFVVRENYNVSQKAISLWKDTWNT